eukprot:15286115-Alexandrium_andersonii.AAC.1
MHGPPAPRETRHEVSMIGEDNDSAGATRGKPERLNASNHFGPRDSLHRALKPPRSAPPKGL